MELDPSYSEATENLLGLLAQVPFEMIVANAKYAWPYLLTRARSAEWWNRLFIDSEQTGLPEPAATISSRSIAEPSGTLAMANARYR